MLTPGDVVELDLGMPAGTEAGLRRPAVVLTAERILAGSSSVVQVVPLTRTIRLGGAEVIVEPNDFNGLRDRSAAQCQHVRSIATSRIQGQTGIVGPVVLADLREALALVLHL